MAPALYDVHVEARRENGSGYTLLRLGLYTQCRHADRDAYRLGAQLATEADAAATVSG